MQYKKINLCIYSLKKKIVNAGFVIKKRAKLLVPGLIKVLMPLALKKIKMLIVVLVVMLLMLLQV